MIWVRCELFVELFGASFSVCGFLSVELDVDALRIGDFVSKVRNDFSQTAAGLIQTGICQCS